MTSSKPIVLRTALGKYDHVAPLRDGRVTSDRVELQFVDITPLPKAFRQMVRGEGLDLAEMAVVTQLMAHHYGRPLVGLAIPLWARLPHSNLVCRAEDETLQQPKDLEGRWVGVRAYGQTSGVWVRGVLESAYGVDLSRISWGTMEDSHLPEYVDPPNTRRFPPEPALRDLMMQGQFAAIMGERTVDPSGIRSVIPDAEAAAQAWIAATGIQPVNHTAVMRRDLHDAHPWLAAEIMDLFTRARDLSIAEGGAMHLPYGREANRLSLQTALDYSARQAITPRRYEVDELYLPL